MGFIFPPYFLGNLSSKTLKIIGTEIFIDTTKFFNIYNIYYILYFIIDFQNKQKIYFYDIGHNNDWINLIIQVVYSKSQEPYLSGFALAETNLTEAIYSEEIFKFNFNVIRNDAHTTGIDTFGHCSLGLNCIHTSIPIGWSSLTLTGLNLLL